MCNKERNQPIIMSTTNTRMEKAVEVKNMTIAKKTVAAREGEL